MAASAARCVLSRMMDDDDSGAGFVAEPVEVPHQCTHVVGRVLVTACQDARQCINDDKSDRHSKVSRPDRSKKTIEVRAAVAQVDWRGDRREGHILGELELAFCGGNTILDTATGLCGNIQGGAAMHAPIKEL